MENESQTEPAPERKFNFKNITAERLRERAADPVSLNHHFGPKVGKAVRAVLLTLADLGSDEPELTHEREPAVKRQRV